MKKTYTTREIAQELTRKQTGIYNHLHRTGGLYHGVKPYKDVRGYLWTQDDLDAIRTAIADKEG